MKYKQRLNALKPTVEWQVTKSGLLWSDDTGGAGEIPWQKINQVRLRLEPSRAETRRVGLHIYAPYDHHITNIHYQGVMNFKAQSEAFHTFVLAFHAGFPNDHQTQFHQGSTRGAYFGNAAISLLLLIFLFYLAPVLAITGLPSAGSIFRIALIILFVPLMGRLLIKNRPSTYLPNQVPEQFLT